MIRNLLLSFRSRGNSFPSLTRTPLAFARAIAVEGANADGRSNCTETKVEILSLKLCYSLLRFVACSSRCFQVRFALIGLSGISFREVWNVSVCESQREATKKDDWQTMLLKEREIYQSNLNVNLFNQSIVDLSNDYPNECMGKF